MGLNIVYHLLMRRGSSGSIFIIFRYLFPWLVNDLDIVISYIGITLQVVTIQKFLVLVFDTEIGRLCLQNALMVLFHSYNLYIQFFSPSRRFETLYSILQYSLRVCL